MKPLLLKNRRLGLLLTGLVCAMLGLAYAFVPLYETFCKIVGIPIAQVGTNLERVPLSMDGEVSDRQVTIRFMGTVNRNIPLEFAPQVTSTRLNLGAPMLMAYTARNTADTDVLGIAVHQALGMGGTSTVDVLGYIDLEQCFCFDAQTYPAGEQVTLPVSFAVRADLPPEIHTITFQYTMFRYEG
jgi:cytochrome c oxidase assembly protein subunit 11